MSRVFFGNSGAEANEGAIKAARKYSFDKYGKEYNIPIQLRTYLEDIIEDDKGVVLGAKVRTGYRFPRANSGKVKYIRARNGVLLAAGGFAQNVTMRMSHDPRLTAAFGSTNQPGATGEALQDAQFLGANTVHMDWIQLGPWTSPDEQGFGKTPLLTEPLVASCQYPLQIFQ